MLRWRPSKLQELFCDDLGWDDLWSASEHCKETAKFTTLKMILARMKTSGNKQANFIWHDDKHALYALYVYIVSATRITLPLHAVIKQLGSKMSLQYGKEARFAQPLELILPSRHWVIRTRASSQTPTPLCFWFRNTVGPPTTATFFRPGGRSMTFTLI